MGILTDMVKATPLILLEDPNCAADVTDPTLIDVSAYEGYGLAIVIAKAVSGTLPTAAIKLQESATAAGTHSDVTDGAFTAVSGTSQVIYAIPVNFNASLGFLGAYVDLGGTTPVIGITVIIIGQKKYN